MKNKILKIIESNSRLTTSDISKMLNIDEASVINVLSELEKDNIICGYTSIINWDKVSDELVNALIEVKAIPEQGKGFDNIADQISNFPEVDSIYLISGSYDFLVEIKGKSMKEVSEFVFSKLSTLESITSTATHFVLKKYKDHGFNLNKDKKQKRENLVL